MTEKRPYCNSVPSWRVEIVPDDLPYIKVGIDSGFGATAPITTGYEPLHYAQPCRTENVSMLKWHHAMWIVQDNPLNYRPLDICGLSPDQQHMMRNLAEMYWSSDINIRRQAHELMKESPFGRLNVMIGHVNGRLGAHPGTRRIFITEDFPKQHIFAAAGYFDTDPQLLPSLPIQPRS